MFGGRNSDEERAGRRTKEEVNLYQSRLCKGPPLLDQVAIFCVVVVLLALKTRGKHRVLTKAMRLTAPSASTSEIFVTHLRGMAGEVGEGSNSEHEIGTRPQRVSSATLRSRPVPSRPTKTPETGAATTHTYLRSLRR